MIGLQQFKLTDVLFLTKDRLKWIK